ncbi:E3 ubiquitin/ISG15 ligase TRIM25-like [Gastrophryne carolinensis]
MESTDLRKELECAVCLNIYTDPVTLICGHSFCRVCINRVLDRQDASGSYYCPQCRQEFSERPARHKNISLRNIAEHFRSTQPAQKETDIFCTYCVYADVLAVKSCVHCEASLCEDHLRVHSKSPEHVLLDPTISLENRKCSVHKKILEYYCVEDAACICVSCRLDDQHQGHQVQSLEEASKEKKHRLNSILQSLISRSEAIEEHIQSVQDCWKQVQDSISEETERLSGIFRDLDDLENRILHEIFRQKELLTLSVFDLIQRLETKKNKLPTKMQAIEELCNMTDSLMVLQHSGDYEDKDRHDEVYDRGSLDIFVISDMLHKGLSDIIAKVTKGSYIPKPADIALDAKTVGRRLLLSRDKKTAEKSEACLDIPETKENFYYDPQVISVQTFSSGRHYWEVDVLNSWRWRVGMCYSSIGRKREDGFLIGCNKKSWCLSQEFQRYSVQHDYKETRLPSGIFSNRIRIYLDYEAGQISFYGLCEPTRHIYTFTTTFTEPLHAALYVWKGSITISGRSTDM